MAVANTRRIRLIDIKTNIALNTSPHKPILHGESHNKVVRLIATIISYLFHPVFMPLIMALALQMLSPNSFAGIPAKRLFFLNASIAITAVLFPLITVGLMKGLGFLKDFQLKTSKERIAPLMGIMMFYFWISHVVNSMPGINIPLAMKVLLLGNFWGVIAVFIINIFTKISMHTAAAGGMLGIVIVLMIVNPVNMIVPFFVALIY